MPCVATVASLTGASSDAGQVYLETACIDVCIAKALAAAHAAAQEPITPKTSTHRQHFARNLPGAGRCDGATALVHAIGAA